MIHLVGNSHISFFPKGGYEEWCVQTQERQVPYVGDYDPDFRTMHLGPILAHSFGSGRPEYEWVLDNLPQDAKVLFVLGEIDCRRHIRRQAVEQHLDIRQVCQNVVEGYLRAVNQFSGKNRKLGVMVPHMTLCDGAEQTREWLDRLEVVAQFEDALRIGADHHPNITTFSINRELVSHGHAYLQGCLWKDQCHLSPVLQADTVGSVQRWMER